MRKKILLSMCLISFLTLITASVLLSIVYASIVDTQIKNEIWQQSSYLKSALNATQQPIDLLSSLTEYSGTRITLVDADGTVLYDTKVDPALMDNHLSRPEIFQAASYGYAKTERLSDSLGVQTFYCAMRLENQTILRISRDMPSIYAIVQKGLYPIALLALLIFAASLLLASRLSRNIMEPINSISLDDPAQNHIYDELSPLLARIERHHSAVTENQKAAQMRREFSANVSHELKTPLTSILGSAELLQSGLVRPEDIQSFSSRIYKEAKRLITLVEDIIRLSRLDERRVEEEKRLISLQATCLDVLSRLESTAKEQQVALNLQGEDIALWAVPGMVEELVFNLAENALKYNRVGGSVQISLSTTDKDAMICVADTGIGISPEHQERVFERFYRVDKSHSKQTGGTGLGLSIVKHIAEYHNGDLRLESTVNVGTTVWVRLPKQ